jgi:hypothetical protein
LFTKEPASVIDRQKVDVLRNKHEKCKGTEVMKWAGTDDMEEEATGCAGDIDCES